MPKKKLFREIHLWLSVPFGLIITLVCFSGAMLVFEDEVVAATEHNLLCTDNADGRPLPMDTLRQIVAATLPDSVAITGITAFKDPDRAYRVSLSKPRRAALYVDQYTGEIKGIYERPAFFATMFRLHRWLLDSPGGNGGMSWGKTVVGISTIMFVLALLSGVVVWWPRSRKSLRNSFTIATRHNTRRLLHDLHTAGGIYAVTLLLAMALTGLTWSFAWYRTGFYGLFGVEMSSGRGGHTATSGHRSDNGQRGERPRGGDGDRQRPGRADVKRATTGRTATWQAVYDHLRTRYPNSKQITVADGTANVTLGGFGNQRAADSFTFDSATGRITGTTPYNDSDKAGKLRGWIYSVHVGNWGGLFTRILWFAAALFGATLPLTGYYLWAKRLANRRRQDKSRERHG